MTPSQLRAWRLTLPTGGAPATRRAAAHLLNDTPPSSYSDWETGRRRIPRMLPLACLAVNEGWTVPPLWEDKEETP